MLVQLGEGPYVFGRRQLTRLTMGLEPCGVEKVYVCLRAIWEF